MRHRVLVIEDDHAFADVLSMTLEREGHGVTIAPHQRAAYHLLDENGFDFVLLDLWLPTYEGGMDKNPQVGFDILDHIRDRFTRSQLPVIVMTADQETEKTAVRALRAGANGYITKHLMDSPVSLDEKLISIAQSIEEASRAPSARRHKLLFTREGSVEINGIEVKKSRFADLLRLLSSRTLMLSRDRAARNAPGITGRELAKELGVRDHTVRKNVSEFKKWISGEYKSRGMGPIDDNDIIRNPRDWKGYELNFETCYISSE